MTAARDQRLRSQCAASELRRCTPVALCLLVTVMGCAEGVPSVPVQRPRAKNSDALTREGLVSQSEARLALYLDWVAGEASDAAHLEAFAAAFTALVKQAAGPLGAFVADGAWIDPLARARVYVGSDPQLTSYSGFALGSEATPGSYTVTSDQSFSDDCMTHAQSLMGAHGLIAAAERYQHGWYSLTQLLDAFSGCRTGELAESLWETLHDTLVDNGSQVLLVPHPALSFAKASWIVNAVVPVLPLSVHPDFVVEASDLFSPLENALLHDRNHAREAAQVHAAWLGAPDGNARANIALSLQQRLEAWHAALLGDRGWRVALCRSPNDVRSRGLFHLLHETSVPPLIYFGVKNAAELNGNYRALIVDAEGKITLSSPPHSASRTTPCWDAEPLQAAPAGTL